LVEATISAARATVTSATRSFFNMATLLRGVAAGTVPALLRLPFGTGTARR
jgi:hypothetical protein